jgi:hypothetical protein
MSLKFMNLLYFYDKMVKTMFKNTISYNYRMRSLIVETCFFIIGKFPILN